MQAPKMKRNLLAIHFMLKDILGIDKEGKAIEGFKVTKEILASFSSEQYLMLEEALAYDRSVFVPIDGKEGTLEEYVKSTGGLLPVFRDIYFPLAKEIYFPLQVKEGVKRSKIIRAVFLPATEETDALLREHIYYNYDDIFNASPCSTRGLIKFNVPPFMEVLFEKVERIYNTYGLGGGEKIETMITSLVDSAFEENEAYFSTMDGGF